MENTGHASNPTDAFSSRSSKLVHLSSRSCMAVRPASPALTEPLADMFFLHHRSDSYLVMVFHRMERRSWSDRVPIHLRPRQHTTVLWHLVKHCRPRIANDRSTSAVIDCYRPLVIRIGSFPPRWVDDLIGKLVLLAHGLLYHGPIHYFMDIFFILGLSFEASAYYVILLM